MPNTEVKPLNADGTWLVTTWESRKLPVTKRTHADHSTACVFLCVNFIKFVELSNRQGSRIAYDINDAIPILLHHKGVVIRGSVCFKR